MRTVRRHVDRESELLLLLAGTARSRAAARPRIAELLRNADLRRLAGELERRRLLALLGPRLCRVAGGAVPRAFAAAVRAAQTRAQAEDVERLVAVQEAVAVLRAAGIAALPLHEAEAVLVPVEDVAAAERLVGGRGVDVCWRLHWYERAFARDVLERGAPEADRGAVLLLLLARDGLAGVRRAAELADWWDRHGAELAIGVLDRHVVRYPELARAWRTAAAVAERVAGVPVSTWLSAPLRLDRRERLAARLADWTEEPPAANAPLVDALLAPPGSALSIIRHAREPGLVQTGLAWARALARVRSRPCTPLASRG
jgi:hypothetical protein